MVDRAACNLAIPFSFVPASSSILIRRAERNQKTTPHTVASRYCVVDDLMELDVLLPYFLLRFAV